MWPWCCRAESGSTSRSCAASWTTPDAALADEGEITHDFGGFELGSLPPVAALLGVETIVDPTVHDHGPVIFAAGSQTESVKVDAKPLFDAQSVRFAQIAEVWNEGRA